MNWTGQLELAARELGERTYRRNWRRCRKQCIGKDDCIQDARLAIVEMLSTTNEETAIASSKLLKGNLPKGSSKGENVLRLGGNDIQIAWIDRTNEEPTRHDKLAETISQLANEYPACRMILMEAARNPSSKPRDWMTSLGWQYADFKAWLRFIEAHLLNACKAMQ